MSETVLEYIVSQHSVHSPIANTGKESDRSIAYVTVEKTRNERIQLRWERTPEEKNVLSTSGEFGLLPLESMRFVVRGAQKDRCLGFVEDEHSLKVFQETS